MQGAQRPRPFNFDKSGCGLESSNMRWAFVHLALILWHVICFLYKKIITLLREKTLIMETINFTENVQVTIPTGDLSLLRSIAKRMGWIVKRPRKSGIEKGLEDVKNGNVFHANNPVDLVNQILG